MLVKRAPPTEQDYIFLASNESLSSEVILTTYYDLTFPGNYQVKYEVASAQLFYKGDNGLQKVYGSGQLISNTLDLIIK
jgi:hypothetical protein